MCRESLPVWQRHAVENQGRVEVRGIALGADRARVAAVVDQFSVTFPMLLDPEYQMAEVFGMRSVRNGLLFDGAGRLQFAQVGGFDVRLPEIARIVQAWMVQPSPNDLAARMEAPRSDGATDAQALRLFRAGVERFHRGDVGGALGLWHRADEQDPGNPVIEEQIWSVEHPERFFEGDVDEEWKAEQARGEFES